MKVNLEFPIKKRGMLGIGDVLIDHLILRRPTVADMRGLNFDPAHQIESFRVLIHRISGLPLELIDKIDVSDWQSLGDAFARLTSRGMK